MGKTGLTVSEVCLGTMTFGSMADEPTSRAILDKAFDAGVDFIDVAEVYPVPPQDDHAGRSEEIVGRWLSGKKRDEVIVATKVAGPSGGWFKTPVRSGKGTLDRHHIERAVNGSLKRLGTDYIDLYQTHWPRSGVADRGDTAGSRGRHVRSGKVRYVGCSNETAYRTDEGAAHVSLRIRPPIRDHSEQLQHGEPPLPKTSSRPCASANRWRPPPLQPSCRRGPLQRANTRGAHGREGARFTLYRQGGKRGETMTKRFVNEKTLETTARLTKIAAECEMSVATFAIAWTLARSFVGSTIVGATKVDQVSDLVRASDVKIPESALAACDDISRSILYPMY